MGQDMKVNNKFTGIYPYVKKLLFLVVLLSVGATNTLGVTITYHIINLGKLDNDGNITSGRTEALKFTSTKTTLGVPDNYKSPLAKNWKYYQTSEVTYNGSTKVCTFNSGPTLSEGQTMAGDADIYVTYELDDTKFSDIGITDGDVCYIKFGNNKYLRQNAWEGDPNTDSDANLTGDGRNIWKINIKDPYQITIQSKSNSYNDYYLSSKNGAFSDIRLRSPLSTAKTNKVWAFGLLPGSDPNTYRLIVADGYTASGTNLDSNKHGYLNNKDSEYKTRFSHYTSSYSNCNLVFVPIKQTYTYHIVDTKGNEAISYTMPEATSVGETLNGYASIPEAIRSPYLEDETISFYNNVACNDEYKITETPTTSDIYVKYTTTHLGDKFLHLRGARALNITIGGDYIYDNGTAGNGTFAHNASPTEDDKS